VGVLRKEGGERLHGALGLHFLRKGEDGVQDDDRGDRDRQPGRSADPR